MYYCVDYFEQRRSDELGEVKREETEIKRDENVLKRWAGMY